MTIADNYKTLALAILRQAQMDYRADTIRECKYKTKIKWLESKQNLTIVEKKNLGVWHGELRRLKANKDQIIEFWNDNHLWYDDVIKYEIGLRRFNEIEKEAISDYQAGTYKKGRIKK